jgi:hypothetical protein
LITAVVAKPKRFLEFSFLQRGPGPGSYDLKDSFDSRKRTPAGVKLNGRPKQDWVYMGYDRNIPDCGTYSTSEDIGKYRLSKFRNACNVSMG